ncbi:MAG: 3-isopropylmalate dehydratase small subunit [Acidobacteria bacterium]|nr:3-isopropylmalate dehydratase small subunit [Acidobacteriota bacterium]MBK9528463.1 3-isopropylmalate dehydratase small subunit [Acidobacteriota bacterium]MBP7474517.1 3-isopropylmalate dehydratase small subunit [Pyrinomonadaceae bacterium]MBP9108293.1 3-isopropylmalate dehydratase small subunit [Pyrinomonadaceae bacterium]
MDKFETIKGLVAPLFQANIDTDQIIPKQFLTRIERTGYGAFLFNDWRLNSDGSPKPNFVLNDQRYAGASILVAGANFGCGSSREHAPWSLLDYGFRVVIAPSFGDIFFNNSLKNGLLPVRLDEKIVNRLVEDTQTIDGYSLTIDLENKTVADASGVIATFEIDEFRRYCLLNGLDDIGLTLQHEEKITAFESKAGR